MRYVTKHELAQHRENEPIGLPKQLTSLPVAQRCFGG